MFKYWTWKTATPGMRKYLEDELLREKHPVVLKYHKQYLQELKSGKPGVYIGLVHVDSYRRPTVTKPSVIGFM